MNNSYVRDPILIIGTGIGGISVLNEIRNIDAEIPILVVDENNGCTYLKPMLSKICQSGFDTQVLQLKNKDEIESKYNCKVLSNTKVVYVDTSKKTVTLNNDDMIRFSSLVIATGSLPRKTLYNSDKENIIVHNVSSWKDYSNLIDELTSNKRIAIVGAGIVGCEIAYDLSHRFDSVNLITPDAHVLSNLDDHSLSENVLNRLLNKKIKVFKSAKNIIYKSEPSQSVCFELNKEVLSLNVEIIIECVGNDASTKLINGKYLEFIPIDNKCQTEFNSIYALGDCASYNGNVFSNIFIIRKCAKTIAGNILDVPSAFQQEDYNIVIKVGKPLLKKTINVK